MKFDKLKEFDTFRWERIKDASLIGTYDMPVLQTVHDVDPHNLVPFHMAKTATNADKKWYHFYEDDYQFERKEYGTRRISPMVIQLLFICQITGTMKAEESLLMMESQKQEEKVGLRDLLKYGFLTKPRLIIKWRFMYG